MKRRWLIALLAAATWGCPNNPVQPVVESDLDESIFAEQVGHAMRKATPAQLETFEAGRAVAERRFDTDTGLGPKFNVTFCAACHERPTVGGSAPRYRDFFLVAQELSDGSTVQLGTNGVQSQFSTLGLSRVDTQAQVNHFSTRNAIPFFGVGAIAALDEASILANVDERDDDGDGISGRANYDRGFVGRFGRKAQTVSIEGFIRGPLFNHLGITSNPLTPERKAALPVPSALDEDDERLLALSCPNCQAAAPDEPNFDDDDVPDPELSQQDLFDLVSFAMLLGAPQPDEPTERTERGRTLFEQAQCGKCHVPTLRGPNGDVALYSDLLLHDMGDELADGEEMGVATGREFRTQPLWGVAATQPYMHDGRADTLEDAVLMHRGEGEVSRDAYLDLTRPERADLLAFLNSLGGANVASDGLIPPDEPTPAAGIDGGPRRPLGGEALARFERGRRVFDRDFSPSEGLGLSGGFNGDSCRACHFEPVVGGAGPAGLNVTRQNRGPSMIHRLHTSGTRPTRESSADYIELRNTPSILGLGLIDEIPQSQILERHDPSDEDEDGISGAAHMLPDGRVGRFGWKAGIPTLDDFFRDALSNEIGLTLEAEPGAVAGITTDTDEIPDPEFGGADLVDLQFYGQMLGPPNPRAFTSAAHEGAELFEEVGCADCHTPLMITADGTRVPLYSDLLLHDVAVDGAPGIRDGVASRREFRTPPLWGVRDTAPYMHDGLSPTLEHAILRHLGEGVRSRRRFTELSEAQKSALLEFLESI